MTTQTVSLDLTATATCKPRHTPGIGSLLRLEYLKTSKRRMTRVVFGLMAIAIGGLVGLSYLIERFSSDLTVDVNAYSIPTVIEDSFSLISVFGPIFIIILAAAAAGSDYGWGTIRTIVGTGVGRGRLLLSRFAMMSLTAIALTFVGLASGILASIVIGLIEGQGVPMGWLDASALGDIGLMIVRGSFLMIFFGTIGFVLAQVTRSVAAGIATGIGVMVLGPLSLVIVSTLGNFGDRIDNYLITANTQVINAMNTFGPVETVAGDPTPWQATGLLSLYAAIGLAIALGLFLRRDIAVD